MVDELKSAAIRKRSRLTPSLCLALGSCVLGGVIGASGYVLADRQHTVIGNRHAEAAQERGLLLQALQDARLNGPTLYLEDLASLPLIQEFVALSQAKPDSQDAQELEAYLTTILDAAREETGLDRIVLESADGKALLVAESAAKISQTSDNHELAAAVPDFDNPGTTSGRLSGYLPKTGVNVLLPDASGGAKVTASIEDQAIERSAATTPDVSRTTRLFALLAGLSVAAFGLLGAGLMRRKAPVSGG